MACNHETIPEGAHVSTTRVMRCRKDHLHRVHYYFCYLCGTDLFLHAQQAAWLAYCNLSPDIKEGLGEVVRANAKSQIARGIPVDGTILFSEMPPGFEYGYVLKMEARYNWGKGKGNFVVAAAEARGEIA